MVNEIRIDLTHYRKGKQLTTHLYIPAMWLKHAQLSKSNKTRDKYNTKIWDLIQKMYPDLAEITIYFDKQKILSCE